MYGGDRDQTTICAVSTPFGVGGISVIRVSGPESLKACKEIAKFLPEKPESHKAYFGVLCSRNGSDNIDEVVATFFEVGKSFTGEQTIEISCHGSPIICQRIINELIALNVKPAGRGEFTYRAFMNGRIDLVQAESVLSLIESQSKEASRQALRQLKGDLSKSLEKVEDDLIWCLANIEASIDFSTEGIELIDPSLLQKKFNNGKVILKNLVDSYSAGRILKEGLHITLFGRPNVGKSSLLNMFLEEDRAIVTDIPGTTRDVVHGEILFDDIKMVFSDTAGIRETTDAVEKIGVEKSKKTMADSDINLFVFDVIENLSHEDINAIKSVDVSSLYVLLNKIDLAPQNMNPKIKLQELRKIFTSDEDFELFLKTRVFFVSAVDKTGRKEVLSKIAKDRLNAQAENSVLVSSARQAENLRQALEKLCEAEAQLGASVGAELLAISLKEALLAVQETLGKHFDDQIMDRVFKEFCIGK